MTLLDHVRRLFEHMYWADDLVLGRLRGAPEPAAVRLFAHVLGAERVWLTRLRGEDSRSLQVWPTLEVTACEQLAGSNREEFEEYLATLSPEALPQPFEYTNQQGDSFRSPRIDILTHVATHGTYHRGQIAQTLRATGHEPVNTDFIVWARSVG